MFDLPITELIVFAAVMVLYLAAAIVVIGLIRAGVKERQTILAHLFALAAVGEAVILIFRAIAIKGVPLTGLFESMIVLTLVLGLLYLVFGIFIRQIWFSAVMSWLILAMIVVTAIVAKPAAAPQPIASEPWVIAHALAMILGAAAVILAGVAAYLYLLGSRRLKRKQIGKVIGSVPNIQKLQRINLLGLKVAFVCFTFGLVSGIIGLAVKSDDLGGDVLRWMLDSKVISIFIVWGTLGLILVLRSVRLIKGTRIAHATIAALLWLAFAFVGAHILCSTKHEFAVEDTPVPQTTEEVTK